MSDRNEDTFGFEQIYAGLTPEEQTEAEENLRRYLGVVKRIFEHIQTENPKVLTELHKQARLRKRQQKALR